MQIPLVKGRDFTDDDRDDAAPVVVISEKTAARYWPGQDPIGKRLKPGSAAEDTPWRTVIGVVKDVRQNDFIKQPKPQMYLVLSPSAGLPAERARCSYPGRTAQPRRLGAQRHLVGG